MISILLLNLDRYEETVRTVTHNLKNIGHPFELLVCDNASSDPRLPLFIQTLQPAYYRQNKTNEGIGHGLNQLYLRSKGECIVTIGNDFLLPDDWGKHIVEWLEKVPKAGIAGIDWGHSGLPPISNRFDLDAHWLTITLDRVFGLTALKRSVIEHIGFFAEEFGPYGLEDSDLNMRVTLAGYNSFYIPGLRCEHTGVGKLDDGEYRKFKSDSLEKNAQIFNRRVSEYGLKGLVEPLPPMRDPL